MTQLSLKLTEDVSSRPNTINDVIGLEDVKQTLKYDIGGAIQRGTKIPHILLSGPPGLGKTTIAHIVSKMTGGEVHRVMGSDLSDPSSVLDLASQCKDNDAVFIEEAHGISKKASYILLPWMEEFVLISSNNIPAPKVIFILATTNAGKLSDALRNRCRILNLNYYSVDELKRVIYRAGKSFGYDLDNDDALTLLAQCSRGTPRTAIEQRLDRVLNVMAIDNLPFTFDTVMKTLEIGQIHPMGLEKADLIYCNTLFKIQEINRGSPVSFNLMCQNTGLSSDVISNVIESFLNQSGMIQITPRGRILTELGYRAIGKSFDSTQKIRENTIQYDMEIKNMSNEQTQSVRSRSNSIPDNPEFISQIESMIKAREFSVKKFADANGFSVTDLRTFVSNTFGNRITFKRGRNGGVFWNQ